MPAERHHNLLSSTLFFFRLVSFVVWPLFQSFSYAPGVHFVYKCPLLFSWLEPQIKFCNCFHPNPKISPPRRSRGEGRLHKTSAFWSSLPTLTSIKDCLFIPIHKSFSYTSPNSHKLEKKFPFFLFLSLLPGQSIVALVIKNWGFFPLRGGGLLPWH